MASAQVKRVVAHPQGRIWAEGPERRFPNPPHFRHPQACRWEIGEPAGSKLARRSGDFGL